MFITMENYQIRSPSIYSAVNVISRMWLSLCVGVDINHGCHEILSWKPWHAQTSPLATQFHGHVQDHLSQLSQGDIRVTGWVVQKRIPTISHWFNARHKNSFWWLPNRAPGQKNCGGVFLSWVFFFSWLGLILDVYLSRYLDGPLNGTKRQVRHLCKQNKTKAKYSLKLAWQHQRFVFKEGPLTCC